MVPKSTQLAAAKVAVSAPSERKRREPTRIILIRVILKWNAEHYSRRFGSVQSPIWRTELQWAQINSPYLTREF